MRGFRGKVVGALVVGCLSMASQASADPSNAVATAGGTCSSSDAGLSWSTGVQSQDRDFLLARTSFTGASGSQIVIGDPVGTDLGNGDVAWALFGEPASEAGEPIRGQVNCPFGPLSWSTTIFEVPVAPVTFSGRTTPEPPGYGDRYDSTSRIGFYAEAAGKYQATVTTTSGVVKVNAEPPLSGSKTIPLGKFDAGEGGTVDVSASGLAAASWTVSIERLPDTSAPEVRFSQQPSGRTTKRKASFRFSAGERADFTCRLDKGPFVPCGSPVKTKRLSLGKHDFAVRASDAAGNQSAPAHVRFRIVRRR